MQKYFGAKLFITDDSKYSSENLKINENEDYNEQQNLNKDDANDKAILDKIEPFINEIDNMEPPKYIESNKYISNDKKTNNIKTKKKKIKKMKNYNIRKGDWQCKNCNNINFHFRIICNVCHKNKN